MSGSAGISTYHCPYPGALLSGTLAGNSLQVACTTNNTNPTITITDGGDTFAAQVTASGNQQVQWQTALNIAAGHTDIQAALSAATTSVQCAALEYANIVTTAATDGTSSGANTSGTAACAAAVGAAGDLVLQMAVEDSGAAMTSWTHGTGFTALLEDGAQNTTIVGGFAVQFQVATGAVTPSITLAPATNHWDTVCMALKPSAAAQGTIPTGMRVIRVHDVQISGLATTPFQAQFPCTGNLIVLLPITIPAVTPGTVSDTNTNTWTAAATAFQNGTSGQLRPYFAAGPTCGADMTISMAFTGTNSSGDTWQLWDIAGAATSPIDAGITCGTSTLSGNACETSGTDSTAAAHTLNSVTIVPSTTSGMVFAFIGAANPGPSEGVTPGQFACGWSPEESSSGEGCESANGWAGQMNTANTSRQFGWTYPATAGGLGTWAAMSVAFKAPAAATNFPQVFVIRP